MLIDITMHTCKIKRSLCSRSTDRSLATRQSSRSVWQNYPTPNHFPTIFSATHLLTFSHWYILRKYARTFTEFTFQSNLYFVLLLLFFALFSLSELLTIWGFFLFLVYFLFCICRSIFHLLVVCHPVIAIG